MQRRHGFLSKQKEIPRKSKHISSINSSTLFKISLRKFRSIEGNFLLHLSSSLIQIITNKSELINTFTSHFAENLHLKFRKIKSMKNIYHLF